MSNIEEKIADLVHTPFPEGPEGCWAFARAVLARGGYVLPADQAAALASEAALGRALQSVERPQPWDVVVMVGSDGRQHVGVMVSSVRFIHAVKSGARIDRLAAWKVCGAVLRVVRLQGGKF